MSEHIESVYTNGQMTIDEIKQYRENWMSVFSGVMNGCRIVIFYENEEAFYNVYNSEESG